MIEGDAKSAFTGFSLGGGGRAPDRVLPDLPRFRVADGDRVTRVVVACSEKVLYAVQCERDEVLLLLEQGATEPWCSSEEELSTVYAEIVRGVEMGSPPLLEEHTVKRVVSSAPWGRGAGRWTG